MCKCIRLRQAFKSYLSNNRVSCKRVRIRITWYYIIQKALKSLYVGSILVKNCFVIRCKENVRKRLLKLYAMKGLFRVFFLANSSITSETSISRNISHSIESKARWFSLSSDTMLRILLLIRLSFEKHRSPVQFVTITQK